MCLFNRKKVRDLEAQIESLQSSLNDVIKLHDELALEYNAKCDEADLLAKELLCCWNKRLAHEEDRNGGFSGIEWAGVAGNITRGLESYIKEEWDEEDESNINWMMDMIYKFEGKL